MKQCYDGNSFLAACFCMIQQRHPDILPLEIIKEVLINRPEVRQSDLLKIEKCCYTYQ